MNVTAWRDTSYTEPGLLRAAVLALLVHIIFFVFIYPSNFIFHSINSKLNATTLIALIISPLLCISITYCLLSGYIVMY